MLRIISLGAGVQSSTLALMTAAGEFPLPDCAIFADTGWEPRAVYAHLERLASALPFPVHRVSNGNLRAAIMAEGYSDVPWHIRLKSGTKTIGRRQCTHQFKLRPIQRKIVELMGGHRPRGGCEMWLGISTDEAYRMKPSRVQYIVNRWPLIERSISRKDCLRWLELRGWSAPKSSCIACPYRSAAQWRALTASELRDAIAVDRTIRNRSAKGQQFVHSSGEPLETVDLRSDAQIGQLDLFNDECEGLCGI